MKWQVPADVLPAWVAEMDVTLAPAITARLSAALDQHDAGYPGSPDGVRSAFAGFAQRSWQWQPSVEHITVSIDVASAATRLMEHLVGPDRGVIIMPPVYNAFYDWLGNGSLVRVEVPLLRNLRNQHDDAASAPESGYRMDLPGLEQALAAGTRVVLLCHPHNPVGRVHTPEELMQLADLAQHYGAVVISDEVHAPLTHPGVEFSPFLSVSPAARAVGLALHNATKPWNFAGLKTGLVIRAPEGPWPQAVDAQRLFIEAGHWGVLATEVAYRDAVDWLDTVRHHFSQQAQLLGTLTQQHLAGVGYQPPQASFLGWLDFRGTAAEADPAGYFFEHARVQLSPGESFGAAGTGFARINLGTSQERVERIVTAMGRALG